MNSNVVLNTYLTLLEESPRWSLVHQTSSNFSLFKTLLLSKRYIPYRSIPLFKSSIENPASYGYKHVITISSLDFNEIKLLESIFNDYDPLNACFLFNQESYIKFQENALIWTSATIREQCDKFNVFSL